MPYIEIPQRNTGVVLGTRPTKGWVLGGVEGAELPDRRWDGQWTDFLPVYEAQNRGFETMQCVSSSLLNCLEIQTKFYGSEKNWSDRALAKMDGTTSSGNSFYAAAECVRTKGLIPEDLWPWPNEPVPMTWDAYYRDIPSDILVKAELIPTYTYRWVDATVEGMKAALRKGPLQVCNRYHAFVVAGYDPEGWIIFDTYNGGRGRLPFDYKFEAALLHSVNLMPEPTTVPKIANTLVQCTEAGFPESGAVGYHLDGVILIDPDGQHDKAVETHLIRKEGVGLSHDDWMKFPKKSFKGEPL